MLRMVLAEAPIMTREAKSSPGRRHRLFSVAAAAHPQTPQQLQEGLSLQVTDNIPRRITPEDRQRFWPVVSREKLRRKNKRGYHNTTKMQLTPNAEQDQSDPNTLRVTAKPAMYVEGLALLRPGVPQRLKEEINHGGVAVMWITKDGYLIIEERSEYSQINPGVAGPIGGGLDGKLRGWHDPTLANATP